MVLNDSDWMKFSFARVAYLRFFALTEITEMLISSVPRRR